MIFILKLRNLIIKGKLEIEDQINLNSGRKVKCAKFLYLIKEKREREDACMKL